MYPILAIALFFFKQKTAYEIMPSLVGSEMCIRDSFHASPGAPSYWQTPAQTRLWPNLKRVYPILASHPPIG